MICKLRFKTTGGNRNMTSFILTMWYVNSLITLLASLCIFSFYINYVICKLIQLSISFLVGPSFILTMWYVNVSYLVDNTTLTESFILTMWYVNKDFELNKDSNNVCFILTMWYVNINLSEYLFTSFTGFILTMWYVNLICLCCL